ncbi:hypothetical protein FD687_02410 [Apilactobacillus kunkeei]|nr:hypothetical protein FD687_02410 [Apilactobacillus kunkeei]TMT04064.1 hypothetical protein FD689_02240 [Apilactobacillus kunkeei]
MTDTSTSENKSLIILGNGADVHSGLHTRFKQFMTKDDKIQAIQSALSSFRSIRLKLIELFGEDSEPIADERIAQNILHFPIYMAMHKTINLSEYVEETHQKSINTNMLNLNKASMPFFNINAFQYNFLHNSNDKFEELDQKMDSLKGLTFWEILLVVRECSDKSWYDVEKCMESFFLLSGTNPHPGYTAPECIDFDIQNLKESNIELRIDSTEYEFIIYTLIRLFNVDPRTADNFHCNELLMNQLYKFENKFSNYVYDDVHAPDNKDYYQNIGSLIYSLISNSNSKNQQVNIFNFNYTPTSKNLGAVNRYKNIHGRIQYPHEAKNDDINRLPSDVVFGIDSNLSYPELSSQKAKDDIYLFTKTRRILSRPPKKHNNKYQNNKYEQKVLEDDINEIIFYGHSLGESDYSYFQSIFDHYNLYNSDLSLTFGFSVHNNHTLIESREKQSNRVSKLINKYGETLDNKDHAKNLLHKLLIENRLNIVEI